MRSAESPTCSPGRPLFVCPRSQAVAILDVRVRHASVALALREAFQDCESFLPFRLSRFPSPTWEGFKAGDPVGSKASAPIAHAPVIRPVAQWESVFPVPARYPCVDRAIASERDHDGG